MTRLAHGRLFVKVQQRRRGRALEKEDEKPSLGASIERLSKRLAKGQMYREGTKKGKKTSSGLRLLCLRASVTCFALGRRAAALCPPTISERSGNLALAGVYGCGCFRVAPSDGFAPLI